MASIVHQTDKRSGLTYAYRSVSRWDKVKKQSRATRTLIGRVHPETKEIIPTDGRNRSKKAPKNKDKNTSRLFYGATYLFDVIGEKIGITHDLKQCFPQTYQQILSIVYYLILEDKSPLYRFEKWQSLHKHPYGQNIALQRSSELFSSITEEAKHDFFRLQGKRRLEKEYWAYDITSISSYSETLKQVQYGYNKEEDSLPQLNLALIFGEESHLPFYYRKLSGNIPDSKTLRSLLKNLDILGYSKVKLVMDRGFYSRDNINALFKDRIKFLIGTKMSLVFVRKELDAIYDKFRSFESFNDTYDLYTRTVQATWLYQQKRPYKGDTVSSSKRFYIHYYYNIDQAAEDEKSFDRRIMGLRKELLSGERKPENEKSYAKYFKVQTSPKRGTKVIVNEEEIKKAKKYYGFFALMTNQTMTAIEALEIYRNKDVVEKAFGDLKERLNMRRALVSSEKGLEGKIFVGFVALIYLSYLKKKMQEAKMFKTDSIHTLLDKLDVIEYFETPGKRPYFGEILNKQKDIYTNLGIEVPSSL